ncbi:TlpA family protein disulfide reductase [Actinophytocola sp. NPDC049390]|uniref:TlpA family protein disulfide reductase n=1 Tax=Actinophytocola sp. NPDC049390 TaxID=3363894 RepID=UPI003788CDB0
MIVLTVALVLLAVVTAGHLLLTFALIRRVRDLQNRTGVPHDDGLPAPGTPVGPFSLERLDGSTLDTGDLATGDVLVGFFAAGCSPCTAVVTDLLDDPPAERFVALVDSGETEPTTDLATRLSAIAEVAVVPWESTVSAAFGQEGFPTLLRVRDGVIVEAARARAGLGRLAVR